MSFSSLYSMVSELLGVNSNILWHILITLGKYLEPTRSSIKHSLSYPPSQFRCWPFLLLIVSVFFFWFRSLRSIFLEVVILCCHFMPIVLIRSFGRNVFRECGLAWIALYLFVICTSRIFRHFRRETTFILPLCFPVNEKGSTLIQKTLLPRGANSYLLE